VLYLTVMLPKILVDNHLFQCLHFVLHFTSFVMGERRGFIFDMWVENGKSQPTDDKLSFKRAW